MNHSKKQLILLYQVYSNWCLYSELIFLIYLHSLLVNIHFIQQLILLYQVYSNWCLYNESIFLNYLHSLLVKDHSIILLTFKLTVLFIIIHVIQMFLLSMESILMVKMLSIDYTQIIFNMMIVFHFILFFIRIYWIIQSNSSSYQTNREWW